ncbi:unnamed protein product [Didymodactylos carnosus]|uniref:EF-hand domain-containing protein n=1 Tax=Didymodactylos carnosus TaxID=1234261 RepID=A0A814M622_9BILA|nr:unnamed protein product [Didymodactylos carnosus]CAF1072290.1 unnamed protein product [Didymodactylos carnosus]CAF3539990.1 unnamed protein product [Didymodactylos carnosus]CAF3839290.1 unnamed protein product [Didymodactylos carnosus]
MATDPIEQDNNIRKMTNGDEQHEDKQQQDLKLSSSLYEQKDSSQHHKLSKFQQNNSEDDNDFQIHEGDQRYLTDFQQQKANYFFEVNLDIENKKHLTWEDVEFYLLFHLTIANKEGFGDLEQNLSRKTRELWELIHDTYPNSDRQVLTLSQFLDTWGALSEYIVKHNQIPKLFEEWFKLGFDLYDIDKNNEIPAASFHKLYNKMNLGLPHAVFAHKFLTENGTKPLDFERILCTIKALITSSDDEHYSHFLLPGFFKKVKSSNAQNDKKSDNTENQNGEQKSSKESSSQPDSERKSNRKYPHQTGRSPFPGQQNFPFFINPMFGGPAGFMPQGFPQQRQHYSGMATPPQKAQTRKESQHETQKNQRQDIPQYPTQQNNGNGFSGVDNIQNRTPTNRDPIADDDEYIRNVLRELHIDISEVEIIDGNNQRRILLDKNFANNQEGLYQQPSNVYPNQQQVPPIPQQKQNYPSPNRYQQQNQSSTGPNLQLINLFKRNLPGYFDLFSSGNDQLKQDGVNHVHQHRDQKHSSKTRRKSKDSSKSQQQGPPKPRMFPAQQEPSPINGNVQQPFSYLAHGQPRPYQGHPQQRFPSEQQRSSGIRQVYPSFQQQQRPPGLEDVLQNQYQTNIRQQFPYQHQEQNRYPRGQKTEMFPKRAATNDTSSNQTDRIPNNSSQWQQSSTTSTKDQHQPTVKNIQQQENDKSSPTASINLSTEDATNTQQPAGSTLSKKDDDNKKSNKLPTGEDEDEWVNKVLRRVTPIIEKIVREEVRKTIVRGNNEGASTDSDDEEIMIGGGGPFFDANPFQFLFGGGGPFMGPRGGGRGMFSSHGAPREYRSSQDEDRNSPTWQKQQQSRREHNGSKGFPPGNPYPNGEESQNGSQHEGEPTLNSNGRDDMSESMFYSGGPFGMRNSPFMPPVFMSMMGAPMFGGPGMGGIPPGIRPHGQGMGAGPSGEGYILIMGDDDNNAKPGRHQRPPPSAQ